VLVASTCAIHGKGGKGWEAILVRAGSVHVKYTKHIDNNSQYSLCGKALSSVFWNNCIAI